MSNREMLEKVATAPGFIAALDQSGGSTPGALRQYGVPETAYSNDAEMFDQVHRMRTRIVTAPAFAGDRILGAILFERTMDSEIEGKPSTHFLWQDRHVVPFLKVDQGLAAESDGVSLMKPMPALEGLLKRAVSQSVFGTKMRSVIARASRDGVAAIVAQQFDFARRISEHGLMPIIEPEVSIKSPDKAASEALLRDDLLRGLDALPPDRKVMLKLSLPSTPDFYEPLIRHDRVLRVVALSGGYSRDEACGLLAQNHGMIASFSRALVEDLRAQMDDAAFDATLKRSIDQIYRASVDKV